MAVRRHPISGEPILFAPDRALRPNAFARDDSVDCPFCPGSESMTPPEIMRAGDPWRVRVFPNKYPAVEGHEVIVESNRHDTSFDRIDNAAEVVATYVERCRAHKGAAYVALFKNQGVRAGASIDHIHSQLMPLKFVPPRIELQAMAFAGSSCPLCRAPGTIIEENEAFIRCVPAGSQHAWEQWIVPRRHQADITSMGDDEIAALATILQSAVRAARNVAAAHNVLFMNFPRSATAHFYVDVFPRMTSIAGFELSTGTFIEIIDPADAARRLK